MKKINLTLIALIILLFSACSPKNSPEKIYPSIKSITLDKNIVVFDAPKEVKSNVTFNFGLSKEVVDHVNIGVNKSITPNVKNTDGLNLEKAFRKYNISLKESTIFEFEKLIRGDELLKRKYVPFGANHKIKLIFDRFDMKSGFLFTKTNIKLYIRMQVLDENGAITFENIEVNTNNPSKDLTKKEIIKNKDILSRYVNEALRDVIKKHLEKLKSI